MKYSTKTIKKAKINQIYLKTNSNLLLFDAQWAEKNIHYFSVATWTGKDRKN